MESNGLELFRLRMTHPARVFEWCRRPGPCPAEDMRRLHKILYTQSSTGVVVGSKAPAAQPGESFHVSRTFVESLTPPVLENPVPSLFAHFQYSPDTRHPCSTFCVLRNSERVLPGSLARSRDVIRRGP